tara:strand:- start:314 stop:913 length:600 start_codon:yes stop_codon:yes gene_type:complete
MNLDDVLKDKTYKRFSDKKIPPLKLSSILKSGLYVHSASEVKSWKFIIIDDDKVKESLMPSLYKQTWMLSSNAWIIICSDLSELKKFFKTDIEKYALQDALFAIQNIRVKASSLGINSYFVRSFKEPEIKDVLRIPDDLIIQGVITLGYGKGNGQKLPASKIERHVSFNQFKKSKTDSTFPLKPKIKESIKKLKKKLKK